MLNDRNNFLKDYLRDILPSYYYISDFQKKIKNSKYINDFELSNEFKTKISTYWKQYEKINHIWHKAYIATNGIEDVRYIPEDIFYKKIEPRLNRYDLYRSYSDKNIYDKNFSEFKMAKTICRNMNGENYDSEYNIITFRKSVELVAEFAQNNKIVLKPSIETGGGRNVEVIDLRSKPLNEITKYLVKISIFL